MTTSTSPGCCSWTGVRAVLQFIYTIVENKFEELKIKNDLAVFEQEDLFLLENRLPYQLEDLMGLSEKK
jgi:hypothetical protein